MIPSVLRLVHSLLVTGAIFLLAADAHVLGGGTLPAAETLVVLIALVLTAGMFVGGNRWSRGIAAVLVIRQVLLQQHGRNVQERPHDSSGFGLVPQVGRGNAHHVRLTSP